MKCCVGLVGVVSWANFLLGKQAFQVWTTQFLTPMQFLVPKFPALYRNPYHTYYHIQALTLSTLILEAPHPIRLLIPIRSSRAVHSPPSNVRLSICTRSFRLYITG